LRIRIEVPQLKQLMAWARPQCTRFWLSVLSVLPLRRLVAFPLVILMIWHAVQLPLSARGGPNPRIIPAAQLPAQTATNVDASGSFTASSRSMLFYQRGTEVTGDYTYGGTKYPFTGTVNGYVLTGTFKVGTSNYNFNVTYAADGQSFTGTDSWGGLTGTKQNTAIIRVIPTQAVVKVGGSLSIDGLVGGVPDKGITWSTTGGTIVNGVLTAPNTPGLVTVTAASSVQPTVLATTVVQVTMDANMDASGSYTAPSRSMLFYQLGANVTGDYTYGGTKYPFTGTVNGYVLTGTFKVGTSNYNFNVTYAADGQSFTGTDSWGGLTGTKQNTAIIRVIPTQAVVKVGGSLSIDGLVGGVPDKGITWSTTGGSIANGVLTAPNTPGLVTVTATSSVQPTVLATTVVQVTLDGNMDASGSYTAPSRSMLFYQLGADVTGDYTFGGTKYPFTGTVNGYVLTGTFKVGTSNYTFNVIYAADGQSFTGTDSWGGLTGTKQNTAIIRVIPTQASVKVGGSLSIDGLVGGVPDKGITWSTTGGTIANGVLTAPATPGVYTVTAASKIQLAVKATTVIQVTMDGNMDASGSFTASSRTMLFYQRGTEVTGDYTFGGTKYPFTGTVNGYGLTGIIKVGTSNYNFSATYAADGQSFTGTDSWGGLTATKLSTVSVRLLPLAPNALKSGDTFTYSADVAGSFNKQITWSASVGTIVNGLYTAPTQTGIYTITATSKADAKGTAQVPVYVNTWMQPFAAWTFSEGSGIVAADISGHGFRGTLYSGAAWASGKTGTGLALDGKASYLSVPPMDIFTKPFSISAWVKFDAVNRGGNGATYVSGMDNPILAYGLGGCGTSLNFAERGGKLDFGFGCAGSSYEVYGNTAIQAGQWTHVVATFDGTKKRIYVNGVLDAIQDSGVFSGTGPNLQIGKYPFAGMETCLGTLDEIQIFDHALIDGEVASLYSSTVNVAVTPHAVTLAAGQTQALTATVSGTTNGAVTWELPDPNSGTIAQAVYTAPATLPSAGATYRIVARSVADSTQSDSALVTVKPFVRIVPEAIVLVTNGTYPFQAIVTGLSGPEVTWSATAGSFTGATYTAPATAGSYVVTATSVSDTTKKATATVSVMAGNIPATNGLVGYWKFDANALDASGNGNHGVLSNGTTFTTGQTSWAARFDGLNASVDIPTVNPFLGAFTVSVWVKFDAVNKGTDNAILGHGTSTLNQGLHLGERGGLPYFGFFGNDLAGKTAIQANAWTYLTFVFDGAQKRIYVNGVLDASQNSGAYQSPLANAQIGRYPWSYSWPKGSISTCLGLIDEVQIHSRALTDTEINGLFTARTNVSITPRTVVLALGQTQTFSAGVTGNANTAVTWSLPIANTGTISTTGLYTTPTTISRQGVVFPLKATSQALTTQTDSVQITVNYPVYVTPKALSVPAKGTSVFTAEVTGLASNQVTWTASAGSITSAGVFTAPATTGTVTITATSAIDTTKLGTATVTVTKPNESADVLMAFDEGAGTTTQDSMGSGVTGTLQGSPVWVDGKLGKALDFQTPGAMVLLSPTVPLSGPWTIAAWFIYPLLKTGTCHTLTRGYNGDHQIIIGTDEISLECYDNSYGWRDSGFKVNTLSGWPARREPHPLAVFHRCLCHRQLPGREPGLRCAAG